MLFVISITSEISDERSRGATCSFFAGSGGPTALPAAAAADDEDEDEDGDDMDGGGVKGVRTGLYELGLRCVGSGALSRVDGCEGMRVEGVKKQV